MSEYILYDIPSRGSQPHCWSLNPWKARLALNYKNVPYKTEWVEYPDIAPKFKGYNIAPNDGKTSYAEYSCPAVKFPDGTYIMDSRKIAEALERLQPQPSLHMHRGELIDRTQKAVLGGQMGLAPIVMPRVPEHILPPRSAEYFRETRGKRFGMPLAELAKSDRAGEAAWKNAEPHLNEIKEILSENGDGPYVLGKEPSFADFIIAGFWDFLRRLDQDGDVFERVMKFDESFRRQWDACGKWLEKDD